MQRYSLFNPFQQDSVYMDADGVGPYVLHADHAAAIAAKDARIAELEANYTLSGMGAVLAQRDNTIADLRIELDVCRGALDEKREAMEALGEDACDSDLWATMKGQRDAARAELARVREALEPLRDFYRIMRRPARKHTSQFTDDEPALMDLTTRIDAALGGGA